MKDFSLNIKLVSSGIIYQKFELPIQCLCHFSVSLLLTYFSWELFKCKGNSGEPRQMEQIVYLIESLPRSRNWYKTGQKWKYMIIHYVMELRYFHNVPLLPRRQSNCEMQSEIKLLSSQRDECSEQGDRQARTGQGSQARVARARLGQPGHGIDQRMGIQYVNRHRRAVHQMMRCTAWSILYGRSRGERTP